MTLLNFNFVKKRKVDKKQDENGRDSDWGKICFVGLPPTLLTTPVTLNLFHNPELLPELRF